MMLYKAPAVVAADLIDKGQAMAAADLDDKAPGNGEFIFKITVEVLRQMCGERLGRA